MVFKQNTKSMAELPITELPIKKIVDDIRKNYPAPLAEGMILALAGRLYRAKREEKYKNIKH